MTTGYLWTGQYEEVKSAVEGEGKPHSMELDNETLEGHWSTNNQDGIEYFIIDDAVISKLCILGDDVEPCFEGSSVTKPQVSASFSKESEEDTFLRTLFTMMQDLKSALNKEGGKSKMELEDNELKDNEIVESEVENTEVQEEVVEEPVDDNTPEANPEPETTETEKEESEPEEEVVEEEGEEENADAASDGEVENSEEEAAPSEEFSKEDEEENKEDEEKEPEVEVNNTLAEDYEALKTEFAALKADYDILVEFKNKIDNEKKDELIKSFYMLSDEDKKDVIENKEKYTFDEIKSKLAIICFDKKVNFDLDDNSKNEGIIENNSNVNVTTFSLDNDNNSTPAWIKAVINNRNK